MCNLQGVNELLSVSCTNVIELEGSIMRNRKSALRVVGLGSESWRTCLISTLK